MKNLYRKIKVLVHAVHISQGIERLMTLSLVGNNEMIFVEQLCNSECRKEGFCYKKSRKVFIIHVRRESFSSYLHIVNQENKI